MIGTESRPTIYVPKCRVSPPQNAGSGSLSGGDRCVVHANSDDPGDPAQVSVGSQQGRPMAVGNRGDHAIDHAARSDTCSAATAIDPRGGVKIDGGIETEQSESQQQPAQVGLTLIGSGAGN